MQDQDVFAAQDKDENGPECPSDRSGTSRRPNASDPAELERMGASHQVPPRRLPSRSRWKRQNSAQRNLAPVIAVGQARRLPSAGRAYKSIRQETATSKPRRRPLSLRRRTPCVCPIRPKIYRPGPRGRSRPRGPDESMPRGVGHPSIRQVRPPIEKDPCRRPMRGPHHFIRNPSITLDSG